jgi:hypothetical protein
MGEKKEWKEVVGHPSLGDKQKRDQKQEAVFVIVLIWDKVIFTSLVGWEGSTSAL